jgi:hypothetical protein
MTRDGRLPVLEQCRWRDSVTGRQGGKSFPRLAEDDHGRWYLAVQVTAPDGTPQRVPAPLSPTRHIPNIPAHELTPIELTNEPALAALIAAIDLDDLAGSPPRLYVTSKIRLPTQPPGRRATGR